MYIHVRENRMGNQEWTIQRHRQQLAHNTQNEDKQNKNLTQKIKKMSNMNLTKTSVVTYVLAKGKQFLSLLRHPPCYSYCQEEFEDTKGAIIICISKKDREHNGQKKKDNRTNNDQQNIHIKLKIE